SNTTTQVRLSVLRCRVPLCRASQSGIVTAIYHLRTSPRPMGSPFTPSRKVLAHERWCSLSRAQVSTISSRPNLLLYCSLYCHYRVPAHRRTQTATLSSNNVLPKTFPSV